MKLLRSKGKSGGADEGVAEAVETEAKIDAEAKIEAVSNGNSIATASKEVDEVAVEGEESPEDASPAHHHARETEYLNCSISDVLGGRYRVMSTLGKGVFATVYRCIDVNNAYSDEVAIKVLPHIHLK
jgi:hypothetical protein